MFKLKVRSLNHDYGGSSEQLVTDFLRAIGFLGNDGGRNKVTVLNTRRIGSAPMFPDVPDGVSFSKRTKKTTKANLNGAIKATGQIDKFRYGVLLASEDDTDLIADDNKIYSQVGRNFGAFRLLYENTDNGDCLLYTSPSPRDLSTSRMPSSA